MKTLIILTIVTAIALIGVTLTQPKQIGTVQYDACKKFVAPLEVACIPKSTASQPQSTVDNTVLQGK